MLIYIVKVVSLFNEKKKSKKNQILVCLWIKMQLIKWQTNIKLSVQFQALETVETSVELLFVYLLYLNFHNNNYFDVFTVKDKFENTKGLIEV